MLRLPRLLALTLLLAPTACDDGKSKDTKTSDAKNDKAEKDNKKADTKATGTKADGGMTPTVKTHMKDHFAQGEAVRDALIRGDLDALAEPAKWLAEHKTYETMPEDWKAHVQNMQNAGQLILDGTDLAAKAKAAGQMAAACGSCHTALGQKIEWKPATEGADKSGRSAHMAKHLEASTMLWQGLAGPSDESWASGLQTLSDDALIPEGLADDKTPGAEVAALATAAHEVAKKGADAKEPAARAELYGEFLSTCAGCHEKLDVKL